MTSRRLRTSAALAVLTLLTGCGAHDADRAGSAGRSSATPAATSSSSTAASSRPLSVANVYDRVLAAATYPGLRGTVALTETNSSGTLQLTGTFATYLGAGLHTSDLELRQQGSSPTLWSIRAIGTGLYCRFGAKAWQDFTAAGPTAGTADGTSVRHVAAQLLAGLDQQAYIDLLQTGHNLTTAAAPVGTFTFAASTPIEDGGSTARRYDPDLYSDYEAIGIQTQTFTASFDQQARPTALTEHLASARLTVDYHLSVTGYIAAQVSAPS